MSLIQCAQWYRTFIKLIREKMPIKCADCLKVVAQHPYECANYARCVTILSRKYLRQTYAICSISCEKCSRSSSFKSVFQVIGANVGFDENIKFILITQSVCINDAINLCVYDEFIIRFNNEVSSIIARIGLSNSPYASDVMAACRIFSERIITRDFGKVGEYTSRDMLGICAARQAYRALFDVCFDNTIVLTVMGAISNSRAYLKSGDIPCHWSAYIEHNVISYIMTLAQMMHGGYI